MPSASNTQMPIAERRPLFDIFAPPPIEAIFLCHCLTVMAFFLFKLVRRKIREGKTKDAIPDIKDTEMVEPYLIPQAATSQEQQQTSVRQELEYGTSDTTTHSNSHVKAFSDEAEARHKEEARRRNIRQCKLMLGLALPNFLAAVDVTIVAPAIPLISSHFSKSIFPNNT